jgi:phage FluMu protein Com
MSAVQFHCPLCDGLFQVDDSLSGIEVNCPHCQGLVTVPDFTAPQAPPLPPSEALQLSCPVCTGPFQVTAELSGQQVHCPHCQQVVTVPDLGSGSPAEYSFPPGYSEPPPYSPGYPTQPPAETMLPPASHPLPPPGQQAPPKTSAGRVDENYLYPPGYEPKTKKEQQRPDEQPAPRRPEPVPSSASDPLLPPGTGGAALRLKDASDLLPPGAASASAAASERKPLPASIPTRSKEVVLIPTEKGYVGVQEPVKTIQHHGEEVELRRLTPEEKARRRIVRNTILFVFCVVTLVVVMALFMWK